MNTTTCSTDAFAEDDNILECGELVTLPDGRHYMVDGCYRMGEGDKPSTFEIYTVHRYRPDAQRSKRMTRIASKVISGSDLAALAVASLDAGYRFSTTL